MSKKNREITTVKTFILLLVNIFKFIVFPIRKPLIGIPLIFLLFLIPTLRGVKPAEVHLWYLEKLTPVTQGFVNFGEAINKHSIDPIKETVSKMIDNDGRYVSDDTRLRTSTDLEPGNDQDFSRKFEENNSSNRFFEKAKNSSTTYKVEDSIIVNRNDLLKQEEKKQENIEENIEEHDFIDTKLNKEIEEIKIDEEPIIKADSIEKVIIKADTNLKDNLEKINTIKKVNPGIRFISKPEFIEGKAKIENANTIVINRRKIYLHGIYTPPYSEKGLAAITYLINLIHNKNVRCDVMAYTENDFPTAICYSSGKNINEELVKVGLSQKVEFE